MGLKKRSHGSTAGRVAPLVVGMFLTAGLVSSPVASAETYTASSDVIRPFASSTCFVGSSGTCTTAAVVANASGHFVDIGINNRLRPGRASRRLSGHTAGPCQMSVNDPSRNAVLLLLLLVSVQDAMVTRSRAMGCRCCSLCPSAAFRRWPGRSLPVPPAPLGGVEVLPAQCAELSETDTVAIASQTNGPKSGSFHSLPKIHASRHRGRLRPRYPPDQQPVLSGRW